MHITQDIFPIIKNIVDKHDLLNLLKMEAPSDEYDEESRKIAGGIRECNNVEDVQKLIFNVFRESFGSDIPDNLELYSQIAQNIINAVKKVTEDAH